MTEQTSTDPTATEHLRAGDRITLDEIAVHLNAAAVWLRQLAVAAETPNVPVDLGRNLCDELDSMARRSKSTARTSASSTRSSRAVRRSPRRSRTARRGVPAPSTPILRSGSSPW